MSRRRILALLVREGSDCVLSRDGAVILDNCSACERLRVGDVPLLVKVLK